MKKDISRRTVIAAGAAPLLVPARALSLQTTQKPRMSAGSPDSYARLTAGFRSPSQDTRPWVYWFPLNGNLTREGITADLESMARVGIGGLLYMEVDQGAPKGQADFAGPLWRELFQHACKEAKRLGLQINMNNDAGWCGSGDLGSRRNSPCRRLSGRRRPCKAASISREHCPSRPRYRNSIATSRCWPSPHWQART